MKWSSRSLLRGQLLVAVLGSWIINSSQSIQSSGTYLAGNSHAAVASQVCLRWANDIFFPKYIDIDAKEESWRESLTLNHNGPCRLSNEVLSLWSSFLCSNECAFFTCANISSAEWNPVDWGHSTEDHICVSSYLVQAALVVWTFRELRGMNQSIHDIYLF